MEPLVAEQNSTFLLSKLIKVSSSNTHFDDKINNFFPLLTTYLNIKKMALLLYNQEQKIFTLHSAFNSIETLKQVPLTANPISKCILTKQMVYINKEDLVNLANCWQNFLKDYTDYIVAIPLADERNDYGILLLLDEKKHNFVGEQLLIIEAFCNEISVSIHTKQILKETQKRLSILQTLNGLSKTLSSTIDINTLINIIPKMCCGILFAESGSLNILQNNKLLFSSQTGNIPKNFNFKTYVQSEKAPTDILKIINHNKTFSGYAFKNPFNLNLDRDENYAILSIPLNFQSNYKGNILLFNKINHETHNKKKYLFNQGDLELLSTISGMVSETIEKALTYKDIAQLAKNNENMLNYLSYIYEASSAMLNTINYKELIWIIIKTLTLKCSFNFDKILICFFNPEDKNKELKGAAYWVADKEKDTDNNLKNILKNINLNEAEEMINSGLNLNFAIPITKDSKHAVIKAYNEEEITLGYGDLNYNESNNKQIYAAIPLNGKSFKGAIIINNSIQNEAFNSDNLRALNMLTAQINLAFNNIKLYEDLKKANQSLSQVNGRLIEAEKQAAQGEMGSHLAHEIRNPLVSIGGFTNLLLKKIEPENPLKQYAEIIMKEVKRLNTALNTVLDFAKITNKQITSFKLEDTAQEALEALKYELQDKKLSIKINIEKNLPNIIADDKQVLSIFLNLISNAIQAMEKTEKAIIYIDIYKTKKNTINYVACQITDTGPGINEKILNKIFSPFFTTKEEGTGLGLNIVNKIVSRYDGYIKAFNSPSNIPNSGASIIFIFPAENNTNHISLNTSLT